MKLGRRVPAKGLTILFEFFSEKLYVVFYLYNLKIHQKRKR